MEAVYLDLHIHTTEDANDMASASGYDISELVRKIKEYNGDNDFLISLTDHNTINKSAYLKGVASGVKMILGVELHIKNSDQKDAYHCHAYFPNEINELTIDDINTILDSLYTNKLPDKSDSSIPDIQQIINAFSAYDIMLLPHAGQSHGQFNYSIEPGTRIDSAINRSIYYNQFDGFTARSNKGLETTRAYFQKLGIGDFVNLLTCSDNYSPYKYPDPKASEASEFVPTWMFAEPTFAGVRLSLSESTRLRYQKEKPSKWSQHMTKVSLHNEHIDIDVRLSAGLNVVIGGSSSGKSLFVDSINRKLCGSFDGSVYSKYYGVENIEITNISGMHPYYIPQNYVMDTLNNNEEKTIDKIDLIRSIFPGDTDINCHITDTLNALNKNIRGLINCASKIEGLEKSIKALPQPGSLVINGKIQHNPFNGIQATAADKLAYTYTADNQSVDYRNLEDIRQKIQNNPFVDCPEEAFNTIEETLRSMFEAYVLSDKVSTAINNSKDTIDANLEKIQGLNQQKVNSRERLFVLVSEYVAALKEFNTFKKALMNIKHDYQTQKIEARGHKLSIRFNFSFDEQVFLESLSSYLLGHFSSMDDVRPDRLMSDKFKKKPLVTNHDDLSNKIYDMLKKSNYKTYEIISKDGDKFNELSPGWKTAIILDLILGYTIDNAPIIIDQPEDNLAVNYINKELVEAIKEVKTSKQIIIVSHNATIPMLADAQNIIICENVGRHINITSAPLEGSVKGTSVLDYIANKTDGGKASIKKRVKKYNLKSFK